MQYKFSLENIWIRNPTEIMKIKNDLILINKTLSKQRIL